MSGIVGIVNLDAKPVDQDLLARMTNYLTFRGPDAREIWSHDSVGLGHTMLRTTWEAETERQPLTLDGEVWLTADARIDGRQELVKKLEAQLNRSITSERIPNDAELILYSYEAWNEDCLKHLIGDFAFAIWDGRLKRLFCARDHFGVKPFFYTRASHKFIFSNTLNALRLNEEVADSLNEVAIGDYLLFGVNQDLSTTAFRDILRLPPGHSLTLAKGSITTHRYWTPTLPLDVRREPRSDSYVEQFNELLSDAIEDRLRTNCVSISMSGGLDSTSIAAITRDLLQPGSSLHAYSVVYKKLIPDQEHYYSKAAAEHIGIPVTHINADKYSLFDEQIAGDLDQAEPFLLSPQTGQLNDLLRLCAGSGRVALTGWDGDAFMSEPSSAHFASSAKQLKFKDLAAGMCWYVWTQRGLPPIGFRTRLKRVFGKQVESLPEWIDESFAQRTNLSERWKQAWQKNLDSGETRPTAMHALNSKVWASLFEGYDPGATKLLLEMRHPLIDLRLVEFLLAIPAVPWCVNKHILRVAMKNHLPASVINRPKTGLTGDPALQLARCASVRWLDSFEVSPQLSNFVNLDLRQPIADEQTSDGLWASLRVFALNYWLMSSQSIV